MNTIKAQSHQAMTLARLRLAPLALARLVLAGCVITLMTACDSGPEPDMVMNESTGESHAAIPTERGTMTGKSGPYVSAQLPEGFSVYPGARVLTTTTTDHAGSKAALVVMESAASPAEMRAYYANLAHKAGFAAPLSLTTSESTLVTGRRADGMVFSFTASIALDEAEQEALGDAAISEADGPKERARKFAYSGRAKPSTPSAAPGLTTGQLMLAYKTAAP